MPIERSRHPKKQIEKAVQYAESLGWRVELSKKGHAWGRLYCPLASRLGCKISVWGTPKDADNHARAIQSAVDNCDCAFHDDDCCNEP